MGKEKLLGVQYLRAIAALMVVWYHLYGEIPAYQPFLSVHDWISVPAFRGGVQIFFVISGFVMYVSSIDSAPLHFLHRRIARIVPLYWLMTLAVVALSIVDHSLAKRTDFSVVYLAKSLAFIPYNSPTHPGEIYPLLVPGWSLNYEMFFYALFAASLLLERRFRVWSVLALLGVLIALGAILQPKDPVGVIYTSPFLMLFGIGVLFGFTYRRGWINLPPIVSSAIVLGGFVLLMGPWSGGSPDLFISSVLIVFGAIALDASGATAHWAFLALLGDASYSLYLGHTFVLSIARIVWERFSVNGILGATVFALLTLSGSVIFAILSYRIIERPALRYLTQTPMVKRRETPLPVPGS